jgi:hypothetical protein
MMLDMEKVNLCHTHRAVLLDVGDGVGVGDLGQAGVHLHSADHDAACLMMMMR